MRICLTILLCLFVLTLLALLGMNKELSAAKKTIEQKQADLSIANMQNEIIKKCISEDLRDAVKVAMIKSHPDNGGSVEEFLKFRKLYEAYK